MNNIRKTTVAGMFYEQSAQKLENQIKECFTHDIGPGKLPEGNTRDQQILGVIVPHAGLPCSGPFAAHSYYALAEHGFPDTCILLGPNHGGIGAAVALDPSGEWETPLGSLPIDEESSNKLSSIENITADPQTLRQQENSLEVQLPFIKYLSDRLQKKCSIVPIVMSKQDFKTSTHIGKELASIIKKDKKNIAIIASSDFSHEGYSYGRFPPSGLTADEFARKQDKFALKAIQNKDPGLLIDYIQKKSISMCGYGPIISLLTIAKQFTTSSVELLKYGTSYDTCSDSNTCVGYGALAVTKT
jgi:hypothetical protein